MTRYSGDMGATFLRIRRWTCIASLGTVVILFGAGSAASLMEDLQTPALVEMAHAVNAGDAAAYARLYAPEAVITMHGAGILQGRRAIEAHEVELMSQFPGTRLAFYTVWQKGPSAVVHYGVNGRTTGGAAMGHEGLLFYRFQPSGLIEAEHALPGQPHAHGSTGPARSGAGAPAADPARRAAETRREWLGARAREREPGDRDASPRWIRGTKPRFSRAWPQTPWSTR